ncbi:hypothetical protein I7I50_02299 [Histoplasma capsulatum G186AR]|uniref:Uncharacterized protein n=1 Tax=Ajellomyces capsulatus TaxID=5037 RepID=A0A8H8D666_AJECA|nr:hypothetical protein I7I52_01037 [Histoplasma capsulatum]QSS71462.1 hypothetical protein I7I50_02299 [Histoplasma capsulatum G186AR]
MFLLSRPDILPKVTSTVAAVHFHGICEAGRRICMPRTCRGCPSTFSSALTTCPLMKPYWWCSVLRRWPFATRMLRSRDMSLSSSSLTSSHILRLRRRRTERRGGFLGSSREQPGEG